jgi:hypothetical protein
MGLYYDSLNERVIQQSKMPQPGPAARSVVMAHFPGGPVFAAQLPAQEGLPTVASGAIMTCK